MTVLRNSADNIKIFIADTKILRLLSSLSSQVCAWKHMACKCSAHLWFVSKCLKNACQHVCFIFVCKLGRTCRIKYVCPCRAERFTCYISCKTDACWSYTIRVDSLTNNFCVLQLHAGAPRIKLVSCSLSEVTVVVRACGGEESSSPLSYSKPATIVKWISKHLNCSLFHNRRTSMSGTLPDNIQLLQTAELISAYSQRWSSVPVVELSV